VFSSIADCPADLEGVIMDDIGTWFTSWPKSETSFTSFLRRLVIAGKDKQDPDVALFWAIETDDAELARVAIDNGADVNITDLDLFRRYPEP
jgi:hypothetical protein